MCVCAWVCTANLWITIAAPWDEQTSTRCPYSHDSYHYRFWDIIPIIEVIPPFPSGLYIYICIYIYIYVVPSNYVFKKYHRNPQAQQLTYLYHVIAPLQQDSHESSPGECRESTRNGSAASRWKTERSQGPAPWIWWPSGKHTKNYGKLRIYIYI